MADASSKTAAGAGKGRRGRSAGNLHVADEGQQLGPKRAKHEQKAQAVHDAPVDTAPQLPGQPVRRHHPNAREFKLDGSCHGTIADTLKACIKSSVWYIAEGNLVRIIQQKLKEQGDDVRLVAVYDTLMSMNPVALATRIGAERVSFQPHGESRRFWWGALSSGHLAIPTIPFHALVPLQEFVFEHSALVAMCVARRTDTVYNEAEEAFLAALFKQFAPILHGGPWPDAKAERNAITSAIPVKQVHWAKRRLLAMVGVGALEIDSSAGLCDTIEQHEALTAAQEDEEDAVELQRLVGGGTTGDAEPRPRAPLSTAAHSAPTTIAGFDESVLLLKLESLHVTKGFADTPLNKGVVATKASLQQHLPADADPAVLNFFSALGTILFDFSIAGPEGSSHHPSRSGAAEAAQSVDELRQLATAALGHDWLVTLLAALAGSAHPDGRHEQAELVGFVLAEVIRKVANPQRTKPLQAYTGGKMDANCVPLAVRRMFEELALAKSRQTVRRGADVKCDEMAASAAQVTPPPGGLIVSASDNIGFKHGGTSPKYIQYTSRFFPMFTREQLEALGIQDAATERKPFASVFDSAAKILPTEQDYGIVHAFQRARCTAMIQLGAELVGENILDVDVAREFELGERDAPSAPPVDLSRVTRQVERTATAQEMEQAESGDGVWRDRYGGVHFPDPWQLDFAKGSTIELLAEEALGFLDAQLKRDEQLARAAGHTTREAAIAAGFISVQSRLNVIWLLSDGSPHYTVRRLIDRDRGKWGRIRFYGGCFHTVLEDFRCSGRCFEVFLTDAITSWRDSPGKKRWFLEPGNWVQTAEETPEILDGLYFEAALETQAAKAALTGRPVTLDDVSADEVWAHMTARACEQPMVAIVLMYALFTEAILIAVASESEQDFEAFCVSLRVTLLLFSVTNAFRYVRTTIEQLIEWALASDAEYIIQAHLLFTFVTDWGKPIWADRFVEWFQHDVRAFTGKLWARGKDHMIRRCMLNIRGMLKQKEHERTRSLGAKPEPSRHTTDHDTADFGGFAPSGSEKAGREELSDVMLNTVDYARATQMWCLGKPLIDTQGPQPMGSFLSLDGKRAALDPTFLNLLTIAEERLTASFDQYYLPTPSFIESRPEETSSRFRTVSAYASADTASRKFSWARDYGTDVAYFTSPLAKEAGRKCLTVKLTMTFIAAYRTEYGKCTWASSFPDDARIKALAKSTDPKPAVALLQELCRMRVLITRPVQHGGGGVKWPKEPAALAAPEWTGALSEQFKNHVFINAKPYTPSTRAERAAAAAECAAAATHDREHAQRQDAATVTREQRLAAARARPRRSARHAANN